MIRHIFAAALVIFFGVLLESNVWACRAFSSEDTYKQSEALRRAARNGNTRKVRSLLNRLPRDATGHCLMLADEPPLIWAAYHNYPDVIRVLLNDGADIEARSDGVTALQYAAGRSIESMRVLLDAGADPNGSWPPPRPYVIPVDTPLMVAVRLGSLEATNLLIKHGADVNIMTRNGETALYNAIDESGEDKLQLIEALLLAGANPNLANETGYAVLPRAAVTSSIAAIELLLRSGASVDSGERRGLIRGGVLWDARDSTDTTALIEAAGKGRIDAVRLLLKYGADANHRNNHGFTALMAASSSITFGQKVSKGSVAIINSLIAAGADVNLVDNKGYTALMRSASDGWLDQVIVLLNHGADTYIKNEYGMTAHELAIRKGHHAVAAEISRHNAKNPHSND